MARKKKSAAKVVIYASEDIASWLVGNKTSDKFDKKHVVDVSGGRVLICLRVKPEKVAELKKEEKVVYA
jgi:hypothetical protein